MTSVACDDEKLLEFLYACPVGLIECDVSGEIRMMNPYAMQLLLSIVGEREIANLFSVLEHHAPELRNLVNAFAKPTGRVCENHRIIVDLGKARHGDDPKVLACTLVKLGPQRLMVTLNDVSLQIAQEQRLRQADAWFATLLNKINNYSVLTVTPDGRIVQADDAFSRQLGHNEGNVVGQMLTGI